MLLAAAAFASDPLENPGFRHFYNLEYASAREEFTRQAAADPSSADARNHIAQAILFGEMYRSGALESELVTGSNPFVRRPNLNPSPEDQLAFETAIRESMKLCEDRLRERPADIGALYGMGVAHGLRATYNYLVRKAWLSALEDATKARKLHNRVTEIDPSFVDARMVQGVHDYVVGSLPALYKAVGFLAGYRGDRERGIATLKLVGERGIRNRYDAQVLLAAIYRRERRPADAVPLVEELLQRFPRNPLFRLELAQMHADLGDKAKALRYLDSAAELKKSGTAGYQRLSEEKLAYLKGNTLFWYSDLDQALELMSFAASKASSLDLNTGAMAWMRLGQIHDLRGERDLAKAAYRSAVKYAPESEPGEESRKYLRRAYRR
ncbi:MAG: tetratricopeptide repeat protein [Bryobacteraceae bacterium]|nr:tetratricopeptide repeat protein [Bryobacteraceae bacterium]